MASSFNCWFAKVERDKVQRHTLSLSLFNELIVGSLYLIEKTDRPSHALSKTLIVDKIK